MNRSELDQLARRIVGLEKHFRIPPSLEEPKHAELAELARLALRDAENPELDKTVRRRRLDDARRMLSTIAEAL